MRNIYNFNNKLRKVTILPGYTEWLERFVLEKGRITDYVEDPFFTSQSKEDLVNLSLISAFSSLVLELAERIGFKLFDINDGVITWGAKLTLTNGTAVLVEVIDNDTVNYTVISLLAEGEGEIELSDVVQVFSELKTD